MKRGWKIFWIICALLFAVGSVLSITGLILGAKPSDIGKAMNGVYFNEDGLNVGNWRVPFGTRRDTEASDEFSKQETDETVDEQSFAGTDIRKLKIDVDGADVYVMPAEEAEYSVSSSVEREAKLKDYGYSCDIEGDTLAIKTDKKFKGVGDQCLVINVKIPVDTLDELSVTNGVGMVNIDNIHAEKLSMDIGAGKAYLTDFYAMKAKFNCGAGEINASGSIGKTCDVNCGIGEVVLSLGGTEGDYSYDTKCGVGSIRIGENSINGSGKSKYSPDGASKELKIDCGIGEVSVDFAN